MQASPTSPAYAPAGAIVADILSLLLPPKRYDVAEYALAHRWLRSKSTGALEPWTHTAAPYLREPMECLTSEDYLTVAIVGPGQCGKTSVAENWFLQNVGCDPGELLWYMQTETSVEAYVKDRINTMLEQHDELRLNLKPGPINDSLSFKGFKNMNAQFLSATENNLINKTARRIIADEIDAYPESLGDVMALLNVRRQTYGRHSKILAISHPDRARGLDPAKDWTAGIMALYADSDRRFWYAPCPHCAAWSSFAPIATRAYTLNYPVDATLDQIEATAHLVCPVNGCVIDEPQRISMNTLGCWVADGEEIAQDGTITGERVLRKTAGFWILGLMSPFILGGMGGLARAWVKAERERDVTGEDASLRTVVVKQAGMPYAPPRRAGSISANELANRAEQDLKLGVVPEGVRFLTAAVDIQNAYFEFLIRGWGARGESWIIDRGRILANPATDANDWDKLLREVFQKTYPLTNNDTHVMSIRGCGFDSAGAPGVTQQAYAAWIRWARKRASLKLGVNSGREVWSIIPLKGASTRNPPRLTVTYPDTTRAANKATGATVPVAAFNPNSFKDDLAGQLACMEPGPLYVHFPWYLRSTEQPHIWFEQLVAEEQINGRWEKINPNARNESLDLMVMNHVIAHLHGLPRIDWERPPPWAAPWERNITVSSPVAVGAAIAKTDISSVSKSLIQKIA
jgi:phage terminase large subunit GpA-like protein